MDGTDWDERDVQLQEPLSAASSSRGLTHVNVCCGSGTGEREVDKGEGGSGKRGFSNFVYCIPVQIRIHILISFFCLLSLSTEDTTLVRSVLQLYLHIGILNLRNRGRRVVSSVEAWLHVGHVPCSIL